MSRDGPGPLRRWLQAQARRRAASGRSGLTVSSGPVVRIASFDRQTAQIVAGQAVVLVERRGREVARAYAEVVEAAVSRDIALGRSAASRVPEAIAGADDPTALAFVRAVLDALDTSPLAAAYCVDQGAGIVRDVPVEALPDFVATGVAMWVRDVGAGRVFLSREGAAARELLGAALGFDVTARRGRLTDYAHSHGVDLDVAPGDAGWPAVVADGQLALPSPLRVFGDGRDEQVARVVVARAARRLAAGLHPSGLAETEADLLDLFETRRVDALLRRRLPGLTRALDHLGEAPVARDHALSRQPTALQVRRLIAAWALRLHAPPAASAEARGIYDALLGELIVLDAEGCPPAASVRLAREFARVLPSDGAQSVRVAQPGEVRFLDLRRPAPHVEAPPAEPEPEHHEPPRDFGDGQGEAEEAAPGGDEEAGEGTGPSADADGRESPADPADAAAGSGAATDDAPGAEVEAAPVGAYAPSDEPPEPVTPGDEPGTEVIATYPEWDPSLDELRPDWAQVHERAVQNSDPGFAERTLHTHAATIRALRHLFLALRTRGDRPARRQDDGPELDLDAAIAESIDRRAGRLPPGRAYQRPHQRGRDVAVALLVDLSSSTREVLPGGNRIVDVEKEAVLCLGEALVAAGDRFAVLGFSGHGRDDVQVCVAKDFADRWDAQSRASVGGLRPLLENRDGAAIRHATARLLAQDARTRLLVLLSDGRPLDCGDPAYHGEHARADTADALRSAVASGVRPLCLTVAPEGTDALDRLYGRGAYVIVRDPARLAEQVGHHYAAWAHG